MICVEKDECRKEKGRNVNGGMKRSERSWKQNRSEDNREEYRRRKEGSSVDINEEYRRTN